MSVKRFLVLGGAASGKSAFAESLIDRSGLRKVYLATSRIWDDEMRSKVARHVSLRGAGWLTIEAPLDLAHALSEREPGDIVLLDCATMWLTNHLMDGSDLACAEADLFAALTRCPCDIVIVSNEVGQGIVPDNALARRFRQAQGELNQKLAACADTVIFVTAGLPQTLKGAL